VVQRRGRSAGRFIILEFPSHTPKNTTFTTVPYGALGGRGAVTATTIVSSFKPLKTQKTVLLSTIQRPAAHVFSTLLATATRKLHVTRALLLLLLLKLHRGPLVQGTAMCFRLTADFTVRGPREPRSIKAKEQGALQSFFLARGNPKCVGKWRGLSWCPYMPKTCTYASTSTRAPPNAQSERPKSKSPPMPIGLCRYRGLGHLELHR
jgi:hypothetical protein